MKKNDKTKPLVVIQCYEDRQQTLPLRKVEPVKSDVITNGIANGHAHAQPKKEATDNPPPPPPMPNTNGQQNGEHKIIQKKPITIRSNSEIIVSSNGSVRKNGTLMRTPTPDYNNSKTDTTKFKVNGEKAELDSLESFKLKNPSNVQPKPPSNYFVKAPNGTATMKKLGRPVSVTIGEYASGDGGRREPSKLDFLNGTDKPDGASATEDVSISNRLQSELVLTLSRSNLRKKTEALDLIKLRKDLHRNDDSDSSLDKNFHARYGNNLLPLPPSISIPKVSKLKVFNKQANCHDTPHLNL